MATLEDSIGDLVQQAGLLLDLPEQISNAATTQLTKIATAYQNHIDTLTYTAYVDQVNGVDTNDGSQPAPFATIQKAVDKTPKGGRCFIWLENDYSIGETPIIVNQKAITIQSVGPIKRKLIIGRHQITSTTPNYRQIVGIKSAGGLPITLKNIAVVMPTLDGAWGTYPLANSGLFGAISSAEWDPIVVTLYSCDLDIRSQLFGPLFESSNIIFMNFVGITLNGDITDIRGAVVGGVTNIAGTDVTTLPYMLCNLSQI